VAQTRSLIAALALASSLVALTSSTVRANSAAPFRRDPYAAGGAFLAEPTNLVVEHETLTIDCDWVGQRRECKFEAVYEVSNPTDTAEEVLGVFFGAPQDQIKITIDGADVRTAVTPAQVDEAFRAIPRDRDETEGDHRIREATSAGFVVRVEPGAKRSVKFAGLLEPTYRYQEREGYSLPAIEARHPILGTRPRKSERLDFTYFISPIRTWRGHPSIDITVRSPASWSFSSPGPGWSMTRDGGREVARLTTSAEATPRLTYSFVIPEGLFVNGGPIAGVGAELDEAGPRFRAGYEIGVKDWMIGSLAYESFVDLRRANYTFVAAVEAASPNVIFIIPSFSLGLGLPVQLHSEGAPSVGARGFVGLSFPLLSLFVPIDVYFDDPGHPRAAFMGQLSF